MSNELKVALVDKTYGKLSVALVGDEKSGKSSIISSLCYKRIDSLYTSTIGVQFLIRNMYETKYEIFDLSGSERFSAIVNSYIRNKNVILLCVDLSSIDTIDSSIDKWMMKINKFSKDSMIVLVGCKSDIKMLDIETTINTKMNKYNNINTYFEVSAMKNDNIENLFKLIKEHYKIQEEKKEKKEKKEKEEENILCCCCDIM